MDTPKKHELDAHMHTLMSAESIKADPEIMKHLGPHMQMHMKGMKKTISSIQDIRDARQAMNDAETPAEDAMTGMDEGAADMPAPKKKKKA